ncbi:MAG: hypothetical protein JRI25_17255 [Deltaproteobacteria bacterium]|nr:hypothetical protein [Deltaproteobacteria bacterium]MBW2256325.1 hypothetical protein [Deltaproteobacteria bacterium]
MTVVLGAVGLATLACGGGQMALTPQDQEVVFTAHDLLRTHPSLAIDPSKETWALAKSLGAWELDYEYEDLENAGTPLMVVTQITVDTDPSEAKLTYSAVKIGAAIGFAGGVERVQRDDLLTWGDQDECMVLLNEVGLEVGNYCLLRDGRTTMMWAVVGAVFTEPDEVTETLRPRLEKLAAYDPEAITR